jgi:hypothetical protein
MQVNQNRTIYDLFGAVTGEKTTRIYWFKTLRFSVKIWRSESIVNLFGYRAEVQTNLIS